MLKFIQMLKLLLILPLQLSHFMYKSMLCTILLNYNTLQLIHFAIIPFNHFPLFLFQQTQLLRKIHQFVIPCSITRPRPMFLLSITPELNSILTMHLFTFSVKHSIILLPQQSIKNYNSNPFPSKKYNLLAPQFSIQLNHLPIEFKSVGILSMINSKSHSTLALPFITYQEGQGFSLSKEAQEFLTALPQDRQLGIISIVGKYRTGKSFFVNRVLLEQKKGGFQVGPTINPCTKGLWIWKKTLTSSTNPNMDIIVIDTQGFGGMDENANHDSRIFLFSLLLSSYFIYNSVGSIDENALTTLNLIINLAKEIQTKSNSKNGEDIASFPAFLWVVRDFTLMLQDKNGNKINPKEYLQNALQFQKGSSDAIQNKNKIRRHLKHFFQDRDCEMMVRPTQNEKNLQRLDEMDNTMLRPQFVNQVQAIRSKIFSQVRAKKINGKALNGHLLVSLCKGYMDTINKGNLPTVQSAWFYVCKSEGMRALKEATQYLDKEVEQFLKKPIKLNQLNNLKESLWEIVVNKFKKRALGAEQGNPDLLQKLEKRMQESFGDLVKKNKIIWQQRYKEQSERLTETVKQKIYNDSYNEFSDFVQDFQQIKEQYDIDTIDGDSLEKWKYFNELSQNLYRLAGETITTKINKNLHHEKIMMQQKLQIQEEEIEERQRKMLDEKQTLKARVQQLEKQINKANALEDSHKARALQYKSQHDKLYQKYRQLYNEHQQSLILLEKLKKQSKKQAENDMQETKNELLTIRSTLQKQRALHDMEKKYMEQQLQRYKERALSLEAQCRKTRTTNSKITSDYQQLQRKYEQKKEEAEILEQANNSFSKKIQNLMSENSKKSELMSDHSQWMLQKSYLQNQVSFLKNTLNQNKRLHDALLVALQQSLSTSEGQSNNELVQANKNLSSALQKVQARCKVLEQKYQKVKQFKKLMKSCQSMQCVNCCKWIQTHIFPSHVQQCCGMSTMSLKQKTQPDFNKENLHIAVSQTVIKDGEDKKKPYTQYKVQINMGETKWKVAKRYKQFSELQQLLIHRFPSIKYPPSCNFLTDINNLFANKQKNVQAEERRKSLQQYLRDLTKIEQIRNSQIFKQFLDFPDFHPNDYKATKQYFQTSQKKERLFL